MTRLLYRLPAIATTGIVNARQSGDRDEGQPIANPEQMTRQGGEQWSEPSEQLCLQAFFWSPGLR
jgi:hypothetical protein